MEIIDQPQKKHNKTPRNIEDVLRDGYKFHFGEYHSEMFQSLKPSWLHFIGNSVLMFIGIATLEMIIIFSVFSGFVANWSTEEIEANPFEFIRIILLVYLVAFLFIGFFVVPFRSGTYTFLQRGNTTGNWDFSNFFEVFRTKWFKVAALSLLMHIITYVWVGLPLWLMLDDLLSGVEAQGIEEFAESNPLFILDYIGWIFLSYIPILYFLVSYSLAIPLLLFQTDSIGHALESSRRIVQKKWFHFFGLYIVVGLLTYAGMFLCGIGLLITLHFYPIIIWCVYRDIFEEQSHLVQSS